MITYTYRYNRIIHYFKITRPISKKTHPNSEWHHIVPSSCNGSDLKENLVLLPTRWHYIVHCWLPGVYLEKGDNEGYEKMLFAWNRMQNSKKDFDSSLKNIKTMSLLYEKLRSEYVQIIGNHTSCSGDKNSQYGKHWWKDPNDKTKSMSIKEGDPVPEGWIRGRWQEYPLIYIIDDNGHSMFIPKNETIPNGWHLKEKRCKWCGNILHQCNHPEICKKHQLFPKMIQYFGFDETAIGTERIYSEFIKIKNKLYDLYFNQGYSLDNIAKAYNYQPGAGPLGNFIYSLFGKNSLRNLSEALKNYQNRKHSNGTFCKFPSPFV